MPIETREIKDVVADLDKLRGDLEEVIHGNGHAGLRNLLDDIYGNDRRQRRGLIPRVVGLESRLIKLEDMRKRDIALMKGVAIGMAYVVADTTGLIDLIVRVFGAFVG
jgi:hypothetical protein